MHHMNPEMEQCIQSCLNCHHVCYEMALNHCLETGGQSSLIFSTKQHKVSYNSDGKRPEAMPV